MAHSFLKNAHLYTERKIALFKRNTKSGSYRRKVKSEKSFSLLFAMNPDAQIELLSVSHYARPTQKMKVVFFAFVFTRNETHPYKVFFAQSAKKNFYDIGGVVKKS